MGCEVGGSRMPSISILSLSFLAVLGLHSGTQVSRAVARGLGCPTACGTSVLRPGMEPSPQHWKVDF